MKATLAIESITLNGNEIKNATVELDYTSEEVLALIKAYPELLKSILALYQEL